MELLLSNYPPAKLQGFNSSINYFEKAIKDCEILRIASGYISSDSLVDLKRIIELNKKPRVELLIGMHYFDGFSSSQYVAACALNNFLRENDLGFVYLSDTVKFHGKIYTFSSGNIQRSAVVGSSNLSSMYDSVNRLYEVDVLFKEKESEIINSSVIDIIRKLGRPIEEVDKITIVEFNHLLENHENVRRISDIEKLSKLGKLTNTTFDLPIKSEPRSNLNPYFGKGRKNKNGFITPRPWYEVELIVPKKITTKSNYPFKRTFEVFTDDNWVFTCETNGDNSKNFRSKDDLKILGKWIKGRMESKGALITGSPVTDDVIKKYGRNAISLHATDDPNIWFLDFKPNQ